MEIHSGISPSSRLSIPRRRFIELVAGGTLASVVAAACGTSSTTTPPRTTTSFRSRPDLTAAPVVNVHGPYGPATGGYVFVTPIGPLILDDRGQPVWVHQVPEASTNFRVQQYRDAPVLSWWEGEIAPYGVGMHGQCVLVDNSYHEILRFSGANGLTPDLHEFLITGRGTAYITAYQEVEADLSSVKGPTDGRMLDAIIQEIDLATGSVVFEWHSAQHIDISESYEPYSKKYPYDPVHINSIEPTIGGDILVSARNTWTVYRVGTADGAIRWRLGGKHSDFTLGPAVRFAWQHDARSHPSNVMTLFDDEGDPPEARQSRALVLTVDETSRTAEVVRQYHHPSNPLLAGSQGSVQVLPNDNLVVGWGAEPYYTEFRPDGAVVVDAKFAKGASYRAFRFPWVGVPDDRPALTVDRTGSGDVTAYASWNGATQVATWKLLAGASAQAPTTVRTAQRNGFETTIEARTPDRHFSVQAIDDHGKVLGTSLPVTV